MQGKNVLLITIIRVVTLSLSQDAYIVHTQFRTHVCGYLFVLLQLSNILQTLKHANVIIIDEMS
jgi:hypothetical protein